jgi:hypothetical protein
MAAAFVAAGLPAMAQQAGRPADPNLGHFYMARQQIQILDDAPVVNDMRTQPAPAQQQQAGALPNRPVPLPRASWQPYSQQQQGPASFATSLPKTFNGVPPKGPPPRMVAPKMGKAGAYKTGKKPASAKPVAQSSGPPVAKTYAPYQGYGGNVPAARPVATGGAGASTAVKGSLLRWSRTRAGSY